MITTRSIVETLNEECICDNEVDLQRVAAVLAQFSSDTEPSIRCDLAEQLPHVLLFCINQASLPDLVSSTVLPIVEQFLKDTNGQVRKITQNSLLYMLEQNYIDLDFVKLKVSPILVQLMDVVTNLDDYRIEAVTMVSKIIRYVPKEFTEANYLQPFARLCSDVSFHVRRVCAANFGEFAQCVGTPLTETVLLPQFKSLCEDGIWGVRKACADVFVPVSCVCSSPVRKKILAPLFISLLSDQSKWVKSAAFQALGPFISTFRISSAEDLNSFADPKLTGLFYEDGKDQESSDGSDSGCSTDSDSTPEEFKKFNADPLNQLEASSSANKQENSSSKSATTLDQPTEGTEPNTFQDNLYWRVPIQELADLQIETALLPDDSNADETVITRDTPPNAGDTRAEPATSTNVTVINDVSEMHDVEPLATENDVTEQPSIDIHSVSGALTQENRTVGEEVEEQEESESTLQQQDSSCFSQDPPEYREPETAETIQMDKASPDAAVTSESETSYSHSAESFVTPNHYHSSSTVPSYGEAVKNLYHIYTTNISLDYNECVAQYRKVPLRQDIIPNELLYHYINMTNPNNYQAVDAELSQHCAYALPAVALTLGRQYWPCLKETYKSLALDMQWKVRWTLAASLYQMALILGPDYTRNDLLPVFLSFMKDLDEVRCGILQNLAPIIRLLNRPEQLGILPQLSEFLNTDNHRNWRIRSTLAQQLIELASIYDPMSVKKHLFPIAFALLRDKVSEVRMSAIRLMSKLLSQFFSDSFPCDNAVLKTTLETMTAELVEELRSLVKAPKWIYRQVYVLLCEQLLSDNVVPSVVFCKYFLPEMLNLSNDSVPNVRLALSRALFKTLNTTDGLRDCDETGAISTLNLLKSDSDSDVRNFAKGTHNRTLKLTEEEPSGQELTMFNGENEEGLSEFRRNEISHALSNALNNDGLHDCDNGEESDENLSETKRKEMHDLLSNLLIPEQKQELECKLYKLESNEEPVQEHSNSDETDKAEANEEES